MSANSIIEQNWHTKTVSYRVSPLTVLQLLYYSDIKSLITNDKQYQRNRIKPVKFDILILSNTMIVYLQLCIN